MLTLLLETSTERGLVAVADGNRVLGSRPLETQLNQAKVLLPTVQHLLAELGISPKQLMRVGVGIGPGSYTGIRVAVTIAKVMSFSRNIPLVGVPSLMTFIPSIVGPFAAVIDARIGGAYVLIGQKEARQTRFLSEPALVPLHQVGELLKDIPLLVSPNPEPLQKRLAEDCPDMSWQWEACGPAAPQMAILVQQFFGQGHYSVDGQLEVLYLRKTQAEIERIDQP